MHLFIPSVLLWDLLESQIIVLSVQVGEHRLANEEGVNLVGFGFRVYILKPVRIEYLSYEVSVCKH